jgi:hypothetical protein
MSLDIAVLFKGRVVARSKFEGDVVRIGRSPESDVFIDNLGLSRHHATLRRESGVWTLEDLESSGGTFVNGRRVKQLHLTDGDRVGVGKFTLLVRIREAVSAVARAVVKGGRTIAVKDEEPPSSRELRVAYRAKLVLPGGDELTLDRDVIRVGSGKECELALKGWLIPPQVALVTRGLSGFSVVNLAGKGWVACDGRPVDWESPLSPGAKLKFGRMVVKFENVVLASSEALEENEPCQVY